ncbi:MAG: hypothetical protein JW726_19355 [Anaerolineales bacterium]|nr:hypothetical protein [Anaerolineales bacterium]
MMVKTGTIQQLIDVLADAFVRLRINVSDDALEDIAITIHKAMSVEARHFHTPDHVLGLTDRNDPIQSLAALFHDIVYYQVDRGFSPEVQAIVAPYIREEGGDLYIVDNGTQDDICFRIALHIFGFAPSQKLSPNTGLNEFLSTLVMYKKLSGLVPNLELVKIIVYIEGTIPFRGQNAQGYGPFEILSHRLAEVSRDFNLSLTSQEIDAIVQGAVVFANKDVENFSEENPAMFLDNTWKLLQETNIALRSRGFYSIHEYRLALQKMHAFLMVLDPGVVLHRYKGVPPKAEFQRMLRFTRQNVLTAREYLGLKLLTMGILEALAEITGGDAPVSLFMGDVLRDQEDEKGLEDYLPHVEIPVSVNPQSRVYRLLHAGRATQSDFDLKNSPLTLFILKSLGSEKASRCMEYALEMFAGKITAQEFLRHIDPWVVGSVAQASAYMVPTRSDRLEQFIQEIGGPFYQIPGQPRRVAS